MPEDPLAERYTKQKKREELEKRGQKGETNEEVAADQGNLEDAEKVEPIHASEGPGRNDPCPCGSGKKYKKCCMASEE